MFDFHSYAKNEHQTQFTDESNEMCWALSQKIIINFLCFMCLLVLKLVNVASGKKKAEKESQTFTK